MSYEKLTTRERQILDLMFSGKIHDADKGLHKSIAQVLGIGNRTVKGAIRMIGWKYGVDSKTFHLSNRIVYLRAKELGLIS